jgi:hypothetical protein
MAWGVGGIVLKLSFCLSDYTMEPVGITPSFTAPRPFGGLQSIFISGKEKITYWLIIVAKIENIPTNNLFLSEFR